MCCELTTHIYPRPGHKWSGRLKEGFEPDAQVRAALEPVEQSQLVDQHRPERVALGSEEAPGGHLPVRVEDRLELAIEVLDRVGAQLMENPAHGDAVIVMRIG